MCMLIFPLAPFIRRIPIKAFIRGELIRYVKNSSVYKDYHTIRSLFWIRLRRRGYSAKFIEPIFGSVEYKKRVHYIVPWMKAFDSNEICLF